MTDKPYEEMSGPELVTAYNKLAEQATGVKPVTRFADRVSGLKRVKELALTISSGQKGGAPEPKKAESGDSDMTALEKKIEAFEVRSGTNREKVLKKLLPNLGKQIPQGELLKAAYGSQNTENTGALAMVMKGIKDVIQKKKLPYVLTRDRKEKTYGINRK